MKIFAAFRINTTENEMGSIGRLVGYARTSREAEFMAKGQGYYGGSGAITATHIAEVEGLLYELASAQAIELSVNYIAQANERREAALAKLTPEEKALLGLQHV